MVFSIAPVLTGGSQKTIELAHKHHKPLIHIARDGGPASQAQALLRFIQDNKIKTLNVAGPRASKEPEVGAFVKDVLGKALDAQITPAPGDPGGTPAPTPRPQ